MSKSQIQYNSEVSSATSKYYREFSSNATVFAQFHPINNASILYKILGSGGSISLGAGIQNIFTSENLKLEKNHDQLLLYRSLHSVNIPITLNISLARKPIDFSRMFSFERMLLNTGVDIDFWYKSDISSNNEKLLCELNFSDSKVSDVTYSFKLGISYLIQEDFIFSLMYLRSINALYQSDQIISSSFSYLSVGMSTCLFVNREKE